MRAQIFIRMIFVRKIFT